MYSDADECYHCQVQRGRQRWQKEAKNNLTSEPGGGIDREHARLIAAHARVMGGLAGLAR